MPVAFDTLNPSNVAADAATWEKVVRKVRTGLMPPAGMPRPDSATHAAFVRAIESELDRAAAAAPNPGRTEPFHRLNRAEYQNAVRDLLDVNVNVAALLPPDDASYGFDNIAGVLKMSPTLLERYLAAAQKISRIAVGTPPPSPTVDYFRLADDLQQDNHLEGLPLGTRGGIAIRYTFPMDAEYVIRPRLARDVNESVPLYLEPQHLEVSIDGERVQLFTLPGVSPRHRRRRQGAERRAERDVQSGSAAACRRRRPAARWRRGAAAASADLADRCGLRVSGKEREERNHADDNWDVRVRVTAGEHQRDARVPEEDVGDRRDEPAAVPQPVPAAR